MSSQQINDESPNSLFYEDSEKIEIKGFQMVEDIHHLCELKKIQLPLEINRAWHPKVLEIYKKIVSGEIELPEKNGSLDFMEDSQFFIYERDPIDDWRGYFKVHLDSIFYNPKWRNLIYHSLNILKLNSIWEEDIREGPYVSLLPGRELDLSDWVVLLKQDNNGTTFVVSNYRLEYLDEYFVKCVTIRKLWSAG